jgi:hypothetical protein
MQHISQWSAVVAALCLTAACSDSRSPIAPTIPPTISANVGAALCQAELDAVRTAINGATFTGNKGATDRGNLLLKIDAAQAKLAEGKPGDAIQKLGDVRATVVALSTPDAKGKTKLDAAGAAAIIAALDDAEACIQSQTTPAA